HHPGPAVPLGGGAAHPGGPGARLPHLLHQGAGRGDALRLRCRDRRAGRTCVHRLHGRLLQPHLPRPLGARGAVADHGCAALRRRLAAGKAVVAPNVPRRAFEDGAALALRYYAFRGGAWLAERLPLRLTDAVANLGGRIAFRLAKPPRRQMVARNMARVAGAHGPGAGEALVKGAYLSYARYWLETFRL